MDLESEMDTYHPRMRAVNQRTLAEKLNLSLATVSRSLANHPSIKAETRERVQAFAAKLGYRTTPSRNIRHGRLRKSVTIGVIVGVVSKEPGTATFPFILKGIQERAAIDRVSVEVCYQDPRDFAPDTRGNPILRHIRDGDWRGAVLIYPFAPEAVEAISRKISTVAVLEDYVDQGADSIDTDHSAAILKLVDKLYAAGHRNIGFAAWHYPVGGHWTTRRFAAYVEGLYSHGLELRNDWAFNVNKLRRPLSPSELADQVARKVREEGVTGWVCAADHQAYPLIQDLAARGIRVPEDCSVTGFDGISPPNGMKPIATVLVPHEEVGAAAVTRVLNQVRHPHTPRGKILVQGQLIDGTSVSVARPYTAQ